MHLPTRALLAVVLFGLSLSIAPPGRAQPQQREFDCDLPQLELTPALKELFKQAGRQHAELQYGYVPSRGEEERILVGPLKGRYTVEEAFAALLPPGFTLFWINDRTVSVISPPVITPPRLYLGDSTSDDESETSAFEKARKKLEGILVVASRILSLDPLETPGIVLSREDIDALGVSTVAQAVKYLAQQPFTRPEGYRSDGAQAVEQRGLGTDTTLVLINGRRVRASSTAFDTDAFDLNTIPVTAVERIEVLLDSTPLAVGADAIGGMLNIVLRRDLSTPTVEVHYGGAAGGADEHRASVSAGLDNDRLRVTTVLDYFKREFLLGAERERWRDQDYRRFGSTDYRSPEANPGNVTSNTLDNLPGLPSRFASVPSHSPGTQLGTADFLSTAGERNLESLFRYRSIVPEAERISVMASADYDLSEGTTAFGEMLYTDRSTLSRDLPASLSNALVPATNAYNPFGVPVRADFLMTSIPQRERRADSQFVRTLLGLRGNQRRWSWELALLRTADAGQVANRNELDPARVMEALAQSDFARALNVFDDGPGGSAQLLGSLQAAPIFRDYSSESVQATTLARGHLLDLPAGSLSTIIGAEWRRSRISVATTPLGSPDRRVSSAFMELRVPLVDPDMRVPAVKDLAVTAATRLDRYTDIGPLSHSQFDVAWRPINSVTLRATYGTAYRAPSLYELHQPIFTFPFAIPDPKRNNAAAVTTIQAGGNPRLSQTTAESWSAGLWFAPQSVGQLNASAKLWHAELRNRVNPVLIPELFAHEEMYADRVVRAAPTSTDEAAGLPGVLQSLNLTPGNLGTLDASGVDVSMSLDLQTPYGRFIPEVSATWMRHFRTVDLPTVAPSERVGVASVLGTIPKWHAVARTTWSQRGIEVTATARFISAYEDFNVLQNRPSARVIDSQTLLDAQVALQLDDYVAPSSALRGLRITAGLNNVFDGGRDFAEIGTNIGYDPSQGDLKGRFGYLRLSKDF